MNPEWIGGAAGFLTTAAYLPQVIKTCRTRDTSGLSLAMYVSVTVGLVLWIVYGLCIGSTSLIITNVITFMLAASVLAMKLRGG